MSGPEDEAIGCAHLWKSYGATIANRDVSLSVRRGEIHALVGENGAGKSTLMRALYGLEPPDAGEVRIGGVRIPRPSVGEAIARGVGMVHQHFMLVPTLTVAENVVLGREPRRRLGRLRSPFYDRERAAGEVAALARRFGLDVDPGAEVAALSVGEAQRVEIVKALWRGAEVLILDEPTAVLTPPEVEPLFAVLRKLAHDGKTVLLVTHKLDEVMALATRVTVLRRAEVVTTVATAETTPAELVRAMIGRDLDHAPRAATPPAADARLRLEVRGLTVTRPDGSRALDAVDLEVRAGEILGVAGVEGNGQRELALALAGVLQPAAGAIRVDGRDLTRERVRARQRAGVAHVPEDRQARGLILAFSVADNVLLGRDDVYAGPLGLDRARLGADTGRVIARLDVRPPDAAAHASALSGGNQQKVVVGRELLREPAVLVCAQPTRGVDVGASERIHAELDAVRAAGRAVLLISADLDELLGRADRVAVLYRGRVVDCLDNPPGERAATRERIGCLMTGARS